MLTFVHELKEEQRGRICELADRFDGVEYKPDADPWKAKCDVAMPCATQNELDEDAAKTLIKNGVKTVCEGANMPTTKGAAELFAKQGILHAPGKASNAGGVTVSGLEMSQNSMRISWSHEMVDAELREIMKAIHGRCVEHAPEGDIVRYVDGANLAGFLKVAEAMLAYGVV
jgi:glutamate dehydrogenase (NADP+)